MGLKKGYGGRRARKSVKFDCPPWVGWNKLENIYDKSPSELHENLFVTLFLTGGRSSEVVELRSDQVKYNEKLIKIFNMPVRKRRMRFTRDFLIDRKECIFPESKENLTDIFIEFIEGSKHKYLFPQTIPFSGEPIEDNHTSTSRLYYLVRQIDNELYPHWFRGQRSSFLAVVKGLNAIKLAKWFEWKTLDMPLYYVNQTMKEQAEDFGYSVEDVPM